MDSAGSNSYNISSVGGRSSSSANVDLCLPSVDRAGKSLTAEALRRYYFTVPGGSTDWQRLLAFAPVNDIEQYYDELLADDSSCPAYARVWTRHRTDASGKSSTTLWPRDTKRCQGKPKDAVRNKSTYAVQYDFTRYHLDVGVRPCTLYVDVAKLSDTEEYIVVGTLVHKPNSTGLDDVMQILSQVAVAPVGHKTQEVRHLILYAVRVFTWTLPKTSVFAVWQQAIKMRYGKASDNNSGGPVAPGDQFGLQSMHGASTTTLQASDPLAHHKLVAGTDVKIWLKSVNNGRFDRPAYAHLAETMTWWELSTINLSDFDSSDNTNSVNGNDANGKDDHAMNEELVVYARAFSHFCYYKLASSLRTCPSQLKRKDWIRISLHSKEDLMQLGNVPEAVATHMLKQSFIGRGY